MCTFKKRRSGWSFTALRIRASISAVALFSLLLRFLFLLLHEKEKAQSVHVHFRVLHFKIIVMIFLKREEKYIHVQSINML